MSKFLMKLMFLFIALTVFGKQKEILEIGSDDLSHVENISSLTDFKPGSDDFRIYFIGDSITRHGFNKNTIKKLKWGYVAGMAASSENKDYAHLLAADIKKMLPARKVRLFFGVGFNSSRALKGIAAIKYYKPHLIVVQLGEHAKAHTGKEKVKQNYQKLISSLINIKPKALIICTGVWSIQKGEKYSGWSAVVNNIQKDICRGENIPFASVEAYALNPKCHGTGRSSGVRWHPNNQGHAGYAKEIFKHFKQNQSKIPQIKMWTNKKIVSVLPQARVDVKSYDTDGGMTGLKTMPGSKLSYASWIKDPAKKKMHIIFVRSGLKNEWETDEFEFIPEEDGLISIILVGRWYIDKKTKKRRQIFTAYDNIEVEGAKIRNGSFENLNENGKLIGWALHRGAKLKTNDKAKSGENYVIASHDCPIRQKIKVKKGQKVKIKFSHKGINN